jgi:FkbM family methyltransferase
MKTRGGLVLNIPASLQFPFKDIFLHRAYAPRVLLHSIPDAPVVIDLGANAGFFSLFAFHVRPRARCFSFEPMPENFSLLQAHQQMHGHLPWKIYNQAVSAKGGKARLACPEKGGPSTTASLVCSESKSGQRTVEVMVRPLQEIMAQETGGFCDWLKIDVEGSEYEILYSLPEKTYRRIRTLAVESDPVDMDKKNRAALAEYLKKKGFDVFLADDSVLYGINRSFSSTD